MFGQHLPKRFWVFALAILLVLGSWGAVQAISMFTELLAGTGTMEFVDEVEVVKIKVKSTSEVRVRLGITTNTVADHVYTVELYGDDELLGTDTVSWTGEDITGDVKKDVVFTGLSLGSVIEVDVDVVA